MTPPPIDVLRHTGDRLKAHDIAWFKTRFAAGDFAWLRDDLPEGGYTRLGDHIEAGDLAYVRRVLAGVLTPGSDKAAEPGPGADGSSGVPAAGMAAAPGSGGPRVPGPGPGGPSGKVAAGKVASAAAPVPDGERRKVGVWLVPVALLAAIALGVWLSRLAKDDASDPATSESTVVAAGPSTPAAALPPTWY